MRPFRREFKKKWKAYLIRHHEVRKQFLFESLFTPGLFLRCILHIIFFICLAPSYFYFFKNVLVLISCPQTWPRRFLKTAPNRYWLTVTSVLGLLGIFSLFRTLQPKKQIFRNIVLCCWHKKVIGISHFFSVSVFVLFEGEGLELICR